MRLDSVVARYTQRWEPLRTERRVELLAVLALALVILQLFLLFLGSFTRGRIDPVMPPPDSLRVAEIPRQPEIGADDSRDLRARPLFWVSRRPSQVDAAEVASVEDDVGAAAAPRLRQLKVSGVFGGGTAGGAIVSYRGEERRVRVGEALDGWTLDSVSPASVVFINAGVRDERGLLPAPLSSIEGAYEASPSGNEGAQGVESAGSPSPAGAPASATAGENPPDGTATPRPPASSIARPLRRGGGANQQAAGQEQEG